MFNGIDLKIAQLRRRKGMTQQELGERLGVTCQSVSKWENRLTMPDIALLPELSRLFEVSVDEILGLKPLAYEYRATDSGDRDFWSKKVNFLHHSRKLLWNSDYMKFLVQNVWQLDHPVTILDCGCGFGFLGLQLLLLLPPGSRYTGIDFSEKLLDIGRNLFETEHLQGEFLQADIYDYNPVKRYDLVISQAVLRHANDGEALLRQMIAFARTGGLVASIETNREFETAGLYIDGMDYGELCEHGGLKKLWYREKEMQGRDYSIAMKIPHMMKRAGLSDIDVRMNDRVTYLEPGQAGYQEQFADMMEAYQWNQSKTGRAVEEELTYLINHGMNRREAEDFCRSRNDVAAYLQAHGETASLTCFGGMMISFGWK